MYKKAFSAIQLLNIVIQGFFSLLFPIGLGILFSWLGVEKWGAPSWLWVVLTVSGALIGIVSMIRFILSACRAYERLEEQRRKKEAESKPENEARGDSDNGEDPSLTDNERTDI